MVARLLHLVARQSAGRPAISRLFLALADFERIARHRRLGLWRSSSGGQEAWDPTVSGERVKTGACHSTQPSTSRTNAAFAVAPPEVLQLRPAQGMAE